MAESSAARAAQAPTFTDADFDKPAVPLTLGTFDIIAEIKNRSPAEGQLRFQLPYCPIKGNWNRIRSLNFLRPKW